MDMIEKKENKLTFEVELNESLANAVRRYINRIPVMAIDEVEISRNDSPLYDETVAHRIGLIPLKNTKTNKSPELKLDIKNEGMVYSGGIEGDIEIVYKKIPITFLKKGQEIKIIATVNTGKGIDHAKFSPGLMYYRIASEIIMHKKFHDKIKNICPNNEIREKGDNIIILDNKKKDVCDVCEGICEKEGEKIEINFSKNIIITLESFGQLKVEDIFKQSIDVLKKDLQEVSKILNKK